MNAIVRLSVEVHVEHRRIERSVDALVVHLRAELPDDRRRIDATRIFCLRHHRLDVRIDVEVVQQFELSRDLCARQQTANVMFDAGRPAGGKQ